MMPTALRLVTYILFVLGFALAGCDSSDSGVPDEVVVGASFELTGGLPVVGESARRAASLFVEDRNTGGGLTLGTDAYPWSLIVRDNEDIADRAVAVTSTLITEDDVLAVVGPNLSTLAIPAGAVAEAERTPLVTPWATNPDITAGRDWVFQAAFADAFQGPVLAEFATQQYGADTACVLFDRDEAYSSGIAESFRTAWEGLHGAGSIPAYESFGGGDDDITAPLTRIRDANCDVLFAPLFTDDVLRTVAEAQALGIAAPLLGSDSWVSAGLLEACGQMCEGLFAAAHYVPDGATGATAAFIAAYEAAYGATPDDIAALTWDALQVIEQGLKNCGALTGHLAEDRACLRGGIAAIRGLGGVTGAISYGDGGAPAKCVVIGQVQNGRFIAVDKVCP
ncbi:MAG TPA: ABC transporter substrate-binding protein [Rhodothermales bacterium]|nr:ABC transporter substrate-binding protein [Rhodothermales bacterium]